MPGDLVIYDASVANAPKDLTVPDSQDFVLLQVQALLDGSGAGGAYLPSLEILNPGGVVIGRYIGSSVAAGSSAEVTWFPLGRGAASSSGGTGIQFDTEPQSGTYLEVETTGVDADHNAGIYMEAPNAVVISHEPGGSGSGSQWALEVHNEGSTDPNAGGILVNVDALSSPGIDNTAAVWARYEATGHTPLAIFAEVENDSSTASHTGYGVFSSASANNVAPCVAVSAGAVARLASTVSVIGVSGAGTNPLTSSNPVTVCVGGTFVGSLSGTGGHPAISPVLTRASPSTGVIAQVGSDSQQACGVLIDAYTNTGTLYLLRAFANGTEVLRVDAAGNIHLRSGAGIINDLP